MEKQRSTRRTFLKSAVATGAGLIILPSGTLSGANATSNKLNIALIGSHGRAFQHYDSIDSENIVAICDVNEKNLDLAAARFPKAKKYIDWRKCLDDKGIDAVVCCTPDHTHAFIGNWAMNRDLHIYLEKPIAMSVEESRVLQATYQKKKHKLATQAGTQRHAYPNFSRVRELIKDGAIGELRHCYAWGRRQLRKPGYLPAAGSPPKTLDYDLWIGPSPMHPYNPGYFAGKPAANCLNWNMYWDFGTGQVGDMGAHTMDLVWNAIDADLPTSAVAKGEAFNPEVTPVELEATFKVPANDWRGEIGVTWCQGGMMPRSPKKHIDLTQIGHGAMFKGTKGYVIADFQSRVVLPFGDDADFGYYDRRSKEEMTPKAKHFQKEWIDACKGDLKTSCNFDYNGKMAEMMALGLVAYKAGKKLNYDGAKGQITNNAKANELLKRKYRKGWTLNG
ncbi:MAG: Gfo/Idh/MocA family oxidoreductase [Planctomycetes bacterium]|nr:Gfo/Idh/MocA family oxidoreductase [Planctomycetota bacterium]